MKEALSFMIGVKVDEVKLTLRKRNRRKVKVSVKAKV